MKKILAILTFAICLFTISISTTAQQENTAIRAGNKLYRKGQYEKALPEYQKAIQQNPNNPVARYNLGNVQFRNNQFAEAEKTYSDATAMADSAGFKQKTFYNKGVSLSKQQKLLESIEAYKSAVKLDPADEDARFNLQKALTELRKQNESKEQKQPQQQKKSQPKQQPKPRQSNLDKRKIEQYLQSLRQKEQEVQRKIQQNRARAVTKPEKDW